MKKSIGVILAALIAVALPFLFHTESATDDWQDGDGILVIVSPHNEAIRHEFATAFSRWHRQKYGRPVKIDWRVIGGTTEIMRYLASEYIGSMKGYCQRNDIFWPAAAATWILDRSYSPDAPLAEGLTPEAEGLARLRRQIYLDFRTNDSPDHATSGMDLFFGGGVYDHSKAEAQGLTVPPWPNKEAIPHNILFDERGIELIPEELAGERWRSDTFFGTVLSTFGICWNIDRLADIGITNAPSSWYDLASPNYFGNIGVTDPTKSGSIAKAFELIIHQVCHDAIVKRGFDEAAIQTYEKEIGDSRLPAGELPPTVPTYYQQALEDGWQEGVNLVRLIGANSRYFTDSAGKAPVDVGIGTAAAGICIDFFGRFQSEYTKTADGTVHMKYMTPRGGSCVSADPISLLRGAKNRLLGVRFIEFVLGADGQKLWNSRIGTEGGPEKFELRRLPIRRDFYPSEDPIFDACARKHIANSCDNLASDDVNPYKIAESFTYQYRWTGVHFGIQRDLIRAMCLDSGNELRDAWRAIIQNGGADANPEAMALLFKLPTRPVPLTWETAITDYSSVPRLEYMREWTRELRENYSRAKELAQRKCDAP